MKKIAVWSVVLVLVLGLTISAGAVKLVVWESSGPEEDFVTLVGEKYTEETGVKIEVIAIDQLSQGDKLALDGPAGKGADIVVWPHDRIGKAVLQGLLWPLPQDKLNLDGYTESALDALRYQGDLYGLPYAMESVAIIYNKDLLATIPPTFDQFLAEVLKLNKPEENQFGFMGDIGNLYHIFGFVAGYGGYVFKNTEQGLDVDDIGLANQGAIRAANLIKTFRTSGLMPEGTTYDVFDGLFQEGRLAAQINGPWAFGNYQKAGLNYGIAPFPKLDNGEYPRTFIGVKAYYISAFSEHKEEALEFIKWLTNQENSFRHYQETAIIPTRDDVISMPEFQGNKDFMAFAVQAGRGIPMPNVPEMMQVWDPINDALSFILRGQITPEEALPMAVEQIKENIQQMKQ
ncbi:MAG: extracellular solute-binding protein [Halanaerobiales bacterium]|nr:extracellular solute-binding protein [Halanaerobiales bacterium]